MNIRQCVDKARSNLSCHAAAAALWQSISGAVHYLTDTLTRQDRDCGGGGAWRVLGAGVLSVRRCRTPCFNDNPSHATLHRTSQAQRCWDEACLSACVTAAAATAAASSEARCRRNYLHVRNVLGWLGSRVVSMLDLGAEGPGFKSQWRRCSSNSLRQTVHTHRASVHQATKLEPAHGLGR